jgi:Cofactor assembly of complex C subunit B, CCB2/CCB4
MSDPNRSDPNRVVRKLPLVVGGLGGSLLMLNRFVTEDLTPFQSRSDAIGIILSAVLVLTGLLWQQIQPKLPDQVVLDGTEQFDLLDTLPDAVKTELAWASHLLLTNTVTRSLVIYYDGQMLLRRGILPPGALSDPLTVGPIVQRVQAKQVPVYLVAMKLYPGKVEFDYLPSNTQGLICQPMGDRGVMILGANAPRSYTQQDENVIAAIADKLENSLGQSLSQMT